jgi:NitT/TauT family transport system substrate-binding protein
MVVIKKQKMVSVVFVCLILSVCLISACSTKSEVGNSPVKTEDYQKIRVAKQFGLVYAPLVAAEKRGFFQKYGLQVEWITLGSGGSVREAMAAGEIDVAFMGIPPFLIGWDKGLPAKIAAGYAVIPVSLVTYNPDIKTLSDFKPGHKIAVPSPGSIQHILLAMALEKQAGNPNALDDNLVALPHPDGAQAMLAKKDVVAHFTTPPYLFEELAQPGYGVVLEGSQAFGEDFNFNVAVVTKQYHDEHPNGYASFVIGLNDAMNWINENKGEAAELLAPEFKIEKEKLFEYLTADGINYTTAPYGLMGFADFMKKAGYISNVPEELSEIAWENILAQVGKKEGNPSTVEMMQYAK